jgi:hypothetical protein
MKREIIKVNVNESVFNFTILTKYQTETNMTKSLAEKDQAKILRNIANSFCLKILITSKAAEMLRMLSMTAVAADIKFEPVINSCLLPCFFCSIQLTS